MTVDKSHYLVDSLKGISSPIPKVTVPMSKGPSENSPNNRVKPGKHTGHSDKLNSPNK